MKDRNHQKKKAIEEFFISRIFEYRQEYKILDKFEKKFVAIPHIYRTPCQVEVFWISEPLEYQLVVILHDEKREDREIIVNGPFIGSEFIDKVVEIVKEERWERNVPYEPDEFDWMDRDVGEMGRKYSDFLIPPFTDFFFSIRNLALIDSRRGFRSSAPIHDHDWYSIIKGNVIEIEKDELSMIESIHHAKRFAAIEKERKSEKIGQNKQQINKSKSIDEPPRRYQRIIGAYFYPHVRIGDEIELSFRDKLIQHIGTLQVNPTVEFPFRFDEITGFYDTFGFIGFQENSKENAMNLLNTLFGISAFFDIPSYFVKKDELIFMNIDVITSGLGGFTYCSTNKRGKPFSTFEQRKTQISLNLMKKIIEITRVAINDKEISKLVQSYLDAKTYQHKQEYNPAFLSGWSLIESYISKIFEEHNIERTDESIKKGRSINTETLPFKRKIDTLKKLGKITSGEHLWLDQFRKKRNRIAHNSVPVDEKTIQELLDRCRNILSKMILEKGINQQYVIDIRGSFKNADGDS